MGLCPKPRTKELFGKSSLWILKNFEWPKTLFSAGKGETTVAYFFVIVIVCSPIAHSKHHIPRETAFSADKSS